MSIRPADLAKLIGPTRRSRRRCYAHVLFVAPDAATSGTFEKIAASMRRAKP
jgi:hypothetical protein